MRAWAAFSRMRVRLNTAHARIICQRRLREAVSMCMHLACVRYIFSLNLLTVYQQRNKNGHIWKQSWPIKMYAFSPLHSEIGSHHLQWIQIKRFLSVIFDGWSGWMMVNGINWNWINYWLYADCIGVSINSIYHHRSVASIILFQFSTYDEVFGTVKQ